MKNINSWNWYGNITNENIEEFFDVLKKFLISAESYTFVSCYEYKKYEPETRLHQKLEVSTNGTPFSFIKHSDDHKQIIVCDSYGVWGISTGLHDPYCVFEYDKTLTIRDIAPSGLYFYWQIILE